MKLTTHFY